MAGDWIKWTKGLERKREVLMIAAALGRTPEEVAGRLMRLWDWCDDNITEEQIDSDGHAFVTLGSDQVHLIDALAGVTGFADAMTAAGWIIQRNGSLTFPNFSRHNGKTAKSRALSTKRKQAERSRFGHADDGTKVRPEKRREELKKETRQRKKAFQRPTVEEVEVYCLERKNGIDPRAFVDHYEANGWKCGKNKTPMSDWKAAVRTWEAKRKQNNADRLPTEEDDREWTPI